MDEFQGFFVVQDEPFFTDKILVKLKVECTSQNVQIKIKRDGFFVTQDDSGFENGLLVGMMLSNSGVI